MSAQSETDQSKFAKNCINVDLTNSGRLSLLNVDVMTVNKEMKSSEWEVCLRGNRVKATFWPVIHDPPP